MSLNKFTEVERGKALGLRIGCAELETGTLICDSIDVQQQFLEEGFYTSLSDLQGIGVGPHPLLPPGEGSLTIPVDKLRTGSVFKVSCKGIMICPAGATLTFKLQGTTLAGGTFDMIIMTITKVTTSTIKNFTLDFTVACRQSGAKGVAEFAVVGGGAVQVDGLLTPESLANDSIVFDFGTDEAVLLQVTAESDSPTLNIVSRLAEIKI